MHTAHVCELLACRYQRIGKKKSLYYNNCDMSKLSNYYHTFYKYFFHCVIRDLYNFFLQNWIPMAYVLTEDHLEHTEPAQFLEVIKNFQPIFLNCIKWAVFANFFIFSLPVSFIPGQWLRKKTYRISDFWRHFTNTERA